MYNGARKEKAKEYPRKDLEGRLLNQSGCLPFILTSMGGLCSEGHEFIRICKKRNLLEAEHMLDVLVTQHSRWTARRLHRALFGQSLINFVGDSWSPEGSISEQSQRCKRKGATDPAKSQFALRRLSQAQQASTEDIAQAHESASESQESEVFDPAP